MGYRLAKYLAIEASCFDADEWMGETTIVSPLPGVAETAIGVHSLGVAVLGMLPLSDRFSFFGKIGYHRLELEADVTAVVAGSTYRVSFSDEGNDVFYGLGASYRLGDYIAVRLEGERYEFDSRSADMLSLGVAYLL